MNWAGNVGGFLEAFKEGVQKGLGGLLGKEGTTLDGQPLVDGKDENYMNLPWNVRKKFDESVGNQSSIFGLGKPGVDQASIFNLGGPASPGESIDGGGMLFAGAPRFIKYGGPANSIVRPINVDSRHMDHLLNERRKMMGVQLPPFV